MDKLLKSRVQYLLRTKGCTLINLADKDENQRTKLSRQINGSVGLQLSTIEAILTKFPEVSAEWLLRGEGSIDKSDHLAPHIYTNGGSCIQGNNNKGDNIIDTPSQYELYGKDAIIMGKDDLIATLHTQIAELKHDKQVLQMLLSAFTHTNP